MRRIKFGENICLVATIFIVSLLALACQNSADIDGTENPALDSSIFDDPSISDDSPRLRLLLTDAPVDGIDNVWLTISQVIAKMDNGQAVVLSNDSQTLDLLSLRYGVTSTLGISSLPAGTYNQLRLIITDASVVVDGTTHDLFVPSGTTSGIKIHFHMDVTNSEISTMLIDWDASASIHYAPGEGYIMRPVIHIRSFRTEELDLVDPAAPSITSTTHPDSDAWNAANTATFDFSATDNIGADGFSFMLDQTANSEPDEISDNLAGDTASEPCTPSEYPAPPTCTIFEPSVALEDSLVTVYGTSFGNYSTTTSVTVGGQSAEIISVHPSSLTIKVPSGLGSKEVQISTPKGSVACGNNLEVIGDSAFCPDGQFELGKGLLGKVYPTCDSHSWSCKLPDFTTLGEPLATITACQLNVPTHAFEEGFPGVDENLVEWFAIRFTATLIAPSSGNYRFKMNSDDGSNLYIDGNKVIDNDGLHAPRTKTNTVYLDQGEHDFVVEYFQGPRYHIALQLWWKIPGGHEEIIPKTNFMMPANPAQNNESDEVCFCSGHGKGVYDYRAYGVNDGDGKMYYIDLYSDDHEVIDLGTLKYNGKTLTDFEAFAIHNGNYYGVNNSGNSSIKNRLYKLTVNHGSNSVAVSLVGKLKDGNAWIRDIDSLATSPEGELYGLSTQNNKLYTIDVETAALSFVMNVSGNIEGLAFGPSGVLYGTDNEGSTCKLVRMDIETGITEIITVLPWNTDVEALAWHPDGFLYAGIDNTSNSYPSIAKIRPSDGVVVETLDPSVKLFDVEGLDFDFANEEASCACDMKLRDDLSGTATGSIKISDNNNDNFSEFVEFSGDQFISGIDPSGDTLAAYSGIDLGCMKPKSRVSIADLTLNKDDIHGNRFGFVSETISKGFSIEIIKNDCSYETILEGDIDTSNEHFLSDTHTANFWIKLTNVDVTNTIHSNLIAALALQDSPAAIIFAAQTSDEAQWWSNKLNSGHDVGGSYSFIIQPGEDTVGSLGGAELPVCPDPTIHEQTISGQATYSSLEDGIYYFHVKGVDDSGNWGASSHYKIMVDSTKPEDVQVSSSTHVNPEMGYKNAEPEFDWIMDDLSGVGGYSYMIDNYPDSTVDDSIDSQSSTHAFSEMTPGTYWFHIKGVNGAGIWSNTTHFKITIKDPDDNTGTAPGGFVLVPEVEASLLGSPDAHSDRFADEAQHWVKLDSYLIMQKEITNTDYKACVVSYAVTENSCNEDSDCPDKHYCNDDGLCATGCESAPSVSASYHATLKGNYPVTHVNWYDAQRYCISQDMRLPTEAEWEYAAKAEDSDRFPWGDDFDASKANGMNFDEGDTVAGGQFNGEEHGRGNGTQCFNERCLYDMAGNVEEWVEDNYHPYPANTTEAAPADNPVIGTKDSCIQTCGGSPVCIASCDMKITRGGSFLSDAQRLRVFYRDKRPAIYMADHIGFRCAIDFEGEIEEDEEICDGVDNNNNNQIDEGFPNNDSDELADCVDDDDDNDGIKDNVDNCPMAANTDQSDPDMDGYGEVCDPDGEILPISYDGLIHPFDVTLGRNNTMYITGSLDGYSMTNQNCTKKGTVMSVNRAGNRTGQIVLADTSNTSTQYEDFRPKNVSITSTGYLYATDMGGSYDDGVWKIVTDEDTYQLGDAQNPDGRNGTSGNTERFWMGDNSSRGIDNTYGSVIDKDDAWIYVARKNRKDIRRFPLLNNGDISDAEGKYGEDILPHFNQSVKAMAMDSRGWIYFIGRDRYLYRIKITNGNTEKAKRISDGNAFRNSVDLEFDANDNLYILHNKGRSNKWPFRGNRNMKSVPSKSGYISKVAKAVLDNAHNFNPIYHGDETKQQLIYGGPIPVEKVFDSKRLNNPMGFTIDKTTGNLIVANTDENEIVDISLSLQEIKSIIELDSEFSGL